jgi:hypothetical protein
MCQNRAQVQQRLRGMLMHAVARVHHRQARRLLEQPGRAGRVVAKNDRLRAQRSQRQPGVFQLVRVRVDDS